jgi:UDP-3-O-[3-hydroxymyristoyl] glucosamine N-acyltransferase
MPQLALKAQDLADRLGGTLRHCPPDRLLTTVLPLHEAGAGALTFCASRKHQDKGLASEASLVIVAPGLDLGEVPQLEVANAYWAFAQATGWLRPEPEPEFTDGPIHPTAVVGAGCRLAFGVTVGARTVLGAGTTLHPGVHIAEDCVVGENCEFYPGVVLYRRTLVGRNVRIHANTVLGSDGFGYTTVNGVQEKVPQAGWVEVEDDVEIGGATVIDRGALGATRILLGAKVDNLCHISHNVQIGRHGLIAAQAGIAGSATLGDYVTFGGKVGVVGHVHIGSHSICAGSAMVGKNLPEKSFVSGFLARPHREWLATQAALNRLPEILKELRKRKD